MSTIAIVDKGCYPATDLSTYVGCSSCTQLSSSRCNNTSGCAWVAAVSRCVGNVSGLITCLGNMNSNSCPSAQNCYWDASVETCSWCGSATTQTECSYLANSQCGWSEQSGGVCARAQAPTQAPATTGLSACEFPIIYPGTPFTITLKGSGFLSTDLFKLVASGEGQNPCSSIQTKEGLYVLLWSHE